MIRQITGMNGAKRLQTKNNRDTKVNIAPIILILPYINS